MDKNKLAEQRKWIKENQTLFEKSRKDLQIFLALSMTFCITLIFVSIYYLIKTIMS